MRIGGVALTLAGISVLVGLWGDLGALALICFLLPTAFLVHCFWKDTDPQTRMNEQTAFFKDVALAGGALAFFVVYASARVRARPGDHEPGVRPALIRTVAPDVAQSTWSPPADSRPRRRHHAPAPPGRRRRCHHALTGYQPVRPDARRAPCARLRFRSFRTVRPELHYSPQDGDVAAYGVA